MKKQPSRYLKLTLFTEKGEEVFRIWETSSSKATARLNDAIVNRFGPRNFKEVIKVESPLSKRVDAGQLLKWNSETKSMEAEGLTYELQISRLTIRSRNATR